MVYYIRTLLLTLFWLIIAIVLFLSLISYSANDASWSHISNVTTNVSNIAGQSGAWIADILYTFFGVASWWLVIFACYESFQAYFNHAEQHGALRTVGYIFLLLATAALFGLWSISWLSAGVIGTIVSQGLQGLLSPVGTFVFLVIFLAVTAIFSFDVNWRKYLSKISTNKQNPTAANASELIDLSEADQGEVDAIIIQPVISKTATKTVQNQIQNPLDDFLDETGFSQTKTFEAMDNNEGANPFKPMSSTYLANNKLTKKLNARLQNETIAAQTEPTTTSNITVNNTHHQDDSQDDSQVQKTLVTPVNTVAQQQTLQNINTENVATKPLLHQDDNQVNQVNPDSQDNQDEKTPVTPVTKQAEEPATNNTIFDQLITATNEIKPLPAMAAPVATAIQTTPTALVDTEKKEDTIDTTKTSWQQNTITTQPPVINQTPKIDDINHAVVEDTITEPKEQLEEDENVPSVAQILGMRTVNAEQPIANISQDDTAIQTSALLTASENKDEIDTQSIDTSELEQNIASQAFKPTLAPTQNDALKNHIALAQVDATQNFAMPLDDLSQENKQTEIEQPKALHERLVESADFDKPITIHQTPNTPLDIHNDALFAGKSRAMQTAEYRASLSPLPPMDLLDLPDPDRKPSYTVEQLQQLSQLLEIKLQDFNIKGEVVNAQMGPVVTRFEVELAAGVKASKVTGIAKDLARSLSMASVRVVEVIPGKPYIGIEVPNPNRQMVRLIELLQTEGYQDPAGLLSMAMGKDIAGRPVITDLAKAPHMLVAGTTGSGKSVLVNEMLLSLLLKYTPENLRMILIDPKQLELANYNDIPHLLTPVVTDMNEAASALAWCVAEMERRYQLMSLFKVRKLDEFNKKIIASEEQGIPLLDPLWRLNDSVSQDKPPKLKTLPQIVIVADEFADMIMQVGKQAEELITRLAQKSRAAGIHLILATQRPSVDVITGLIKANIPVRAALRVNSKVDSRTILDAGGAEDMLGHGDMLFLGPGQIEPIRVHGAYISDDEVNRICDAWRERGAPDYIDNMFDNFDLTAPNSSTESSGGTSGDEDPLYDEIVAFVMETRKVSTSSIQRKFSIGYNRAARIVDAMEEAGLVSGMGKNGKRELLL